MNFKINLVLFNLNAWLRRYAVFYHGNFFHYTLYTQNCRAKKLKMLTKNQEEVQYDHSGHSSLLFHISIYIIKFMTQLNLDQLMQKEEKKWLKCESLKIYVKILKKIIIYIWQEQH